MIPALLLLAAVSLSPERPQHFVIDAEHVLRPDEIADLSARGIEIQRVLPERRYLVRAASEDAVAADIRVARVQRWDISRKIAASAYRTATRGNAFATVRLVFHDDVSFEDAQDAVTAAGGFVDRPLAIDFDSPHRTTAKIPSTSLTQLAEDDRVFAIYGPPLRIKRDNDEEALFVAGGFMEVYHNVVTVLADAAERAEDIDMARAEEARRRAQATLEQRETDVDRGALEGSLQRALGRLKVAETVRRRPHARRPQPPEQEPGG